MHFHFHFPSTMELREQEKIEKSLKQLRNLFTEDHSQNVKIPPEFIKDDKWLSRFIRVRKFDCDRAYIMIKEYAMLRKKNKKIFRNLVPSCYKSIFDTGMCVVLKERDPWGRKVFVFRTALWDIDAVSIDQIMGCMFLLLEEMVESEQTLQNGVVFVADQATLGLKHFKQFSISRILLILSVLQGKFPLLCKGLHNVNDPNWLMRFGAFAKPFFSTKLQKRVHFHGENYSSFHKFCPVTMLPTCLGGKMSSWDAVQDRDLFDRLYSREKEEYFRRLTIFCDDE